MDTDLLPRLGWLVLGLLLWSGEVWAWGPGHEWVGELVGQRLPAELRTWLGPENLQQVIKHSHVPDDFTPWAQQKRYTISAADRPVLEQYGLKNPYALHSWQGQAANWILLVKAFREQAPDRAGFWLACLAHTTADEAACNHDPLIHYLTYALLSDYGLKTGAGIGLDFAELKKLPDGSALVAELLDHWPATPAEEAALPPLLRLATGGLRANAFMTQRGTRIAASYAVDASPETRAAAWRALGELGVYGVTETLAAVQTAWATAAAGQAPQLNEALKTAYARYKTEFLARRPLADDSLFAQLLTRQAPAGTPAIGVLVESSVSMNEGGFSFGAKYVLAAALRSLEDAHRPFRILDVRRLGQADGELDPAQTPVLLVCAGPFRLPPAAQAGLEKYAEKGGRFFWIGGTPGKCLGSLAAALAKTVPEARLVRPKATETLPKLSVNFLGPWQNELGEAEHPLCRNPNTKAGWQMPVCDYHLPSAGPNLTPLAELRGANGSLIVAVAATDTNGRTNHIFVPEYLLAPYLFCAEDRLDHPEAPRLDPFGQTILMAGLKLLENPAAP